jgi:hypothetical protein
LEGHLIAKGPQAPLRQLGQRRRIGPACRQRVQHLPNREPDNVRRDRAQLDVCPLQMLVQAVHFRRPLLAQVGAIARQLPRFHDFEDAYQARWTVVRLFCEGWHQQSIARFLELSRRHVWSILKSFQRDDFAGLEDQRSSTT